MKIYVASAIFNPRERAYAASVGKALRAAGFETYVPHEDGGIGAVEMEKAISLEELNAVRKRIHQSDIDGLNSSDAVLALVEGVALDSGMCSEIGYMYAKGKPVIALYDDDRSFIANRLNLFVEGCCTAVCPSLEDAMRVLKG